MSDKDRPFPDQNDDRTIFQPAPSSRTPPKPEGTRAPSPEAANQPAFNDDQTVFRVNPAGRRPPGPAAASAFKSSATPPRQPASPGQALGGQNDNPIMQAAGPLLLLLGRLRTALIRVPGSGLTAQIGAAIEACDRRINAAGVAPKEAGAAKYVLCATADEVLANLPAEERPVAPRSLVTRFFGENNGGRRFFDELDRAQHSPRAHYFLLELFHACLALGFQGAPRTLPGGAATLQNIRHDLSELLRNTRPAPQPLSLHWQGQPLASHAVRLRVPLWTTAGVVALLLFGVFAGFRLSLTHRAETAAQALVALNPATPVTISRKIAVAPPPPPPPTEAQVSQLDHIRNTLAPNIAAGTISVTPSANQIVIRVTDRSLFRPGKAAIIDDVRPLMTYIALALGDEKAIKVIGHSDSTPIANARFASNFELSLDRAKAVATLLKQSLPHPERVTAEGRGADDPIASNATPEGRDKNRRVEIIVPRSD